MVLLEDGKTDYDIGAVNNYEFVSTYLAPYMKYTKFSDNCIENELRYTCMHLVDGTILYFHNGSCVDIRVDINGNDAPNKRGYDIFCFYLNVKDVANYDYGLSTYNASTRAKALSLCATNPCYCSTLIRLDGWKIADDYPYKL